MPSWNLVVMSGNVAQAILGEEWTATLSDVFAALRDGGVLAFESRNPAAQAWTHWNRAETYGTRDTPSGRLTEWLDVTEVAADGNVTFEAHNVFGATGEHLVVTSTLAFRDCDQLMADLQAAGFLVSGVRGGWQGEELGEASGLIVVEAQRRPVSA